MIDAERWYEYQKNYQRYGFDMKPEPEPRKKAKAPRKVAMPFANGRKVALSAVVIIGMLMIMLIIVTAYTANIRYSINNTIKENNVLKGEIENLQAKVYSSNNINYIEGKAVGELGMVYSQADNRVYIAEDDMPEEGFADIIREKAYN